MSMATDKKYAAIEKHVRYRDEMIEQMTKENVVMRKYLAGDTIVRADWPVVAVSKKTRGDAQQLLFGGNSSVDAVEAEDTKLREYLEKMCVKDR